VSGQTLGGGGVLSNPNKQSTAKHLDLEVKMGLQVLQKPTIALLIYMTPTLYHTFCTRVSKRVSKQPSKLHGVPCPEVDSPL